MNSECIKVIEEINAAAQKLIAADAEDLRKEQEARSRYEATLAQKAAALDAGDREKYKAAGIASEEARLELEFIEQIKAKKKTPGASRVDDIRIHAVLKSEAQMIKVDALAQLQQIFTEAADVCNAALNDMNMIDAAGKRWDSVVMKQPERPIVNMEDRLALSQFLSAVNAQINRVLLQNK